MNTPKVDLIQLMISDIDEYSKRLRKFLIQNGIEANKLNLNELINAVLKLKTKLSTKTYNALTFDENGYVIGINRMDDFVEKEQVPFDATYGYYKFENNKFVLDEERQRQIDEV